LCFFLPERGESKDDGALYSTGHGMRCDLLSLSSINESWKQSLVTIVKSVQKFAQTVQMNVISMEKWDWNIAKNAHGLAAPVQNNVWLWLRDHSLIRFANS
jgi:hypothetical protein